MQKLLWLMLAGGCGAAARYGLAGVVQRWGGGSFPWGTAAVNVLGCFFFGLVWSVLEQRTGWSPQIRLAVLTGFIGSFTTFSTFMFETNGLLQGSQWLFAILNVVGQLVVGLLLLLLGLAVGRTI